MATPDSRSDVPRIQWDAFNGGEIVCTSGHGPFSVLTRGASARWRHARDKRVSSHVGIVIPVYNQWVMAEMQPQGLALRSLEEYTRSRTNYIVCVRFHPRYCSYERRMNLYHRIALDLRRCWDHRYDYRGAVGFALPWLKQRPKRYYCSEYVRHVMAFDGIVFPERADGRISPYDCQRATTWTDIGWRKQ